MTKCPVCGEKAYVGLSKVECSNHKCRHYSYQIALEVTRTLRDGYMAALHEFAPVGGMSFGKMILEKDGTVDWTLYQLSGIEVDGDVVLPGTTEEKRAGLE